MKTTARIFERMNNFKTRWARRIYPNPVSKILNIGFGDTEINKQIKVFNS